MPSYIVVDVETRKVIITCTVTGLVMFAIGIGIGYASGKGSSNTESPTASVAEAIRATCSGSAAQTSSGKLYFDRFVQRHSEKYACVKTEEECWNLGLPRNYIAYHLNGKTITIDGKLDDDAWKEVNMFYHYSFDIDTLSLSSQPVLLITQLNQVVPAGLRIYIYI
jgi:hypothetical protein